MVRKVRKVHMRKVQMGVRVFLEVRAPKKPTAGGAHSLKVLKVHNYLIECVFIYKRGENTRETRDL